MAIFKQLFEFYLRGSIHVALAVCALILMTQHMFRIPYDLPMAFFGFFGTITGYNFVKYDSLARVGTSNIRRQFRPYAVLSLICFAAAIYCFLQFRPVTQLVSLVVLLLTALYTLPFFPNRRNARNWAGVKIYIVSLCWMGVTVVLPVIDAGIAIDSDFYLKCIQRFILVFTLILIFEIVDLAKDDPHLKTVPQEVGTKATKIIGLLALMIFYSLEFLKLRSDITQLYINVALVVMTGLLLVFANEKRSRHYSSFWAESIPIIWFLMVLMASRLAD